MSCVPIRHFIEAWWQDYQEDYVLYLSFYNTGTVPSNILRSCTNCYDIYVDRTIGSVDSSKLWLKNNRLDCMEKET